MRKLRGNGRRGAALLFVLLLTLVMATLMGAFVSVNRQQIALASDTVARQQAYQACLSGLDWVRSQLEQQADWGTTGFAEGALVQGNGLNVVLHGDSTPNPDSNYAEGEITSPGGVQFRFKVSIVNQLSSFAPEPSAIGECPARAARVRIFGSAQGVNRRLDVVLRRHAFTDASIASGWNIDVETTDDGDGWVLGTRDITNLVRANGTVSAPSAVDGLTRFERSRGQVKAHGDVVLGGRSVSGAGNQLYKEQSEAAAQGTMSPNSKQVEIPELKSEDMKLPDDVIEIPGGRYKMSDFKYTRYEEDEDHPGKWVRVVEGHSGLVTPDDSYANPEVDYSTRTPNQDTPGPEGWDTEPGHLDARPVMWSTTVSGVAKNVVVDVTSGNILVPSGITLKVDDMQGLEFGSDNGKFPTLAMGYDERGSRPAVFAAGGGTIAGAINLMEEKGAALTSKGPIRFGGPVLGLGSLNSDQDITFAGQAGVSAAPNVAVAVRAGGSLVMQPPPGETKLGLRCDGPVFNSAMIADNHWDSYGGLFFLPDAARQAEVNRFGSQPVLDNDGNPLTAEGAWSLMSRELDRPPTWPAGSPAASLSGQLTMSEYIRLREFMRSDDPKWLSDPTRDISMMVSTQLYSYSQWALSNDLTLQAFMAMGGNVPDMWFRGLLYANGVVTVQAGQKTFFNEGAVVSKGSIDIRDSSRIDNVYNRLYLEDLVHPYGSLGVKLDAVYFNLQ